MARWRSEAEAREEIPDVILLDPMFPERRKSALIKKKFQLLQKLERPCADGEELLSAGAAQLADCPEALASFLLL